ncbi:MAG: hypothetical protein NWS54_00220, partial [Porticoccaceae bacterium]|nr:hypothetical protein [Porticoccaceae bacterium]
VRIRPGEPLPPITSNWHRAFGVDVFQSHVSFAQKHEIDARYGDYISSLCDNVIRFYLLKLRSVTSPHKKGHVMNFLVTNAISRRHSRKQGIKLPFKTAFVAAVAIGIWFHFSQ